MIPQKFIQVFRDGVFPSDGLTNINAVECSSKGVHEIVGDNRIVFISNIVGHCEVGSSEDDRICNGFYPTGFDVQQISIDEDNCFCLCSMGYLHNRHHARALATIDKVIGNDFSHAGVGLKELDGLLGLIR